MKGLIVGFGYIAEGHLHGYRATGDMKPVAVVDVSQKRREAAMRLGLQAFSSVEEALGSVLIDFVDVCTPPSSHLEAIRASIEAGLPVMCEKPVFVPGGSAYDDVLAHVEELTVIPAAERMTRSIRLAGVEERHALRVEQRLAVAPVLAVRAVPRDGQRHVGHMALAAEVAFRVPTAVFAGAQHAPFESGGERLRARQGNGLGNGHRRGCTDEVGTW